MKKYRVELRATAAFSIEVEAEDEEAAVDAAMEQAPWAPCAQCGGWGEEWALEYGEWEPADDGVGEVDDAVLDRD